LIVKHNIWKKKKNLENIKKTVAEFKRRLSTEFMRQEMLNKAEKRDFGREELLRKYYIDRIMGSLK